jgi:amino acid transporter
MNWNDDSKSLSRSSLGDGRILPKINKLVPKKRSPGANLTSKSSMMGVLGVVPEENDSELEEGVIKFTSYSQLNAPVTAKITKATKKCTKKLVEKSKFSMASAIVQTIYVIVAIIYLFMIIDVYDNNILAITSILLVLTLVIFTFYTLILIGRGFKIKLVVEVVFQLMVIIIELTDLSFRAQSGFDDNKNSEGNKAINGVATI